MAQRQERDVDRQTLAALQSEVEALRAEVRHLQPFGICGVGLRVCEMCGGLKWFFSSTTYVKRVYLNLVHAMQNTELRQRGEHTAIDDDRDALLAKDRIIAGLEVRSHTDTHRHTQTHRHTDTQTQTHTHTHAPPPLPPLPPLILPSPPHIVQSNSSSDNRSFAVSCTFFVLTLLGLIAFAVFLLVEAFRVKKKVAVKEEEEREMAAKKHNGAATAGAVDAFVRLHGVAFMAREIPQVLAQALTSFPFSCFA